MTDSVYNHIIDNFSEFLGTKNDLPSHNGARFNKKNGAVLTVYKTNLAEGNCVEIAFKPDSVSGLNNICSLTNHSVKPNARYNWPRLGLRNIEEANTVINSLRTICL